MIIFLFMILKVIRYVYITPYSKVARVFISKNWGWWGVCVCVGGGLMWGGVTNKPFYGQIEFSIKLH